MVHKYKHGHKFRMTPWPFTTFVVENYDDTSNLYICRICNSDEIFYFSEEEIFKNSINKNNGGKK